MSRIGKKPVVIPDGVTASLDGQKVIVKGAKGERQFTVHDLVKVALNDNEITVQPVDDSKSARSLWGMSRTMVNNLVVGVTQGFQKTLEIQGVGYRAQLQGKKLQLSLGLSHEVNYSVPDGIEVEVPRPTEIILKGIDQQVVGQVAAEIRAFRPPEPYKGKGIRLSDEYVVRKEGKKK